VIADDHKIIRDAIADALADYSLRAQVGFSVLAEAENGLETIALVKVHRPDLLFLDISMPLANGVEITRDIKRWSSDTKIIVFTGVTSAGLLAGIVESGVDAIFSKAGSPSAMFERLELIMNGGKYVDPDLVSAIERGGHLNDLTERERQTLNMIVAGKSNKEIAHILNISPKTVEKHRGSVMAKLDVHSVAELMVRAIQEGLVDSL
jgi:DNA-binding NarL/FixJ family response regulator